MDFPTRSKDRKKFIVRNFCRRKTWRRVFAHFWTKESLTGDIGNLLFSCSDIPTHKTRFRICMVAFQFGKVPNEIYLCVLCRKVADDNILSASELSEESP